jgi:hypothetical protein
MKLNQEFLMQLLAEQLEEIPCDCGLCDPRNTSAAIEDICARANSLKEILRKHHELIELAFPKPASRAAPAPRKAGRSARDWTALLGKEKGTAYFLLASKKKRCTDRKSRVFPVDCEKIAENCNVINTCMLLPSLKSLLPCLSGWFPS